MFALLWKTRTVLRSIANNFKDHYHQTKRKAENNRGFRGLSRAVVVVFLLFNYYGDQIFSISHQLAPEQKS